MTCGAPPRRTANFPELQKVDLPNADQPTVRLKKTTSTEPIQNVRQQSAHEVSFKSAKYEIVCPKCRQTSIIRGNSLRKSRTFRCLQSNCRRKTDVTKLFIKLAEGQQIVYKRWENLLSYNGRISVGAYWLGLLFLSPVLLLVGWLPIVGAGLHFILLHPVWVKRLHDLGMSGHWTWIIGANYLLVSISFLTQLLADSPQLGLGGMLLYLLTIISLLANIFLGIYISFFPGTNRMNRFGPPMSSVKQIWS